MENFYFCCGVPKSGTTFLQRTLDLHPEISCPSEHNLKMLTSELAQVFNRYAQFLNVVDIRAGGQGVRHIDRGTYLKMLKSTILTAAEGTGQGKPICGLSDNSILDNLVFFSDLMGHPPIIMIVRNPINQGLSAWRHNHRLAKEENNPVHIELMTKQGGSSVNGWLRRCAQKFNSVVEMIERFSQNHSNLIVIRY